VITEVSIRKKEKYPEYALKYIDNPVVYVLQTQCGMAFYL
jgi:hypothetical protein